jgi:hypothetical protein
MGDVWKKLIVWLMFTVLFPFVPIGMGILSSKLLGTPTSFIEVLRSGELCYAAAGISAAALGDALLANVGHFRSLTRMLAGMDVFSVSLALVAGATISQMDEGEYEALAADTDGSFAVLTALFYILAVMQGGASVYLNARSQPHGEEQLR